MYIIKGKIGKLTGTLNGTSENFDDCTKEAELQVEESSESEEEF